MQTSIHQTVAEIVRQNYRTADVFKKYGINYCCGGNLPLAAACAAKGVELDRLQADLDKATQYITLPPSLAFDQWEPGFLVDYLMHVHHAYLRQALPAIEINLLTFVNSHRKKHPELEAIYDAFVSLSALLRQHSQHEEEIIFPYIKQIDNAFRRKESYGNLFVRTLRKPLHSLEQEHRRIGEWLQTIRNLTNQYQFPEGACTNHQVVFLKLKEFDNDLVQHQHLEINLLFPKAIEMERALLQTGLPG